MTLDVAAHPSGRFDVNRNHFQLAMLDYNLNVWLLLSNREPQSDVNALKHTTMATSRFLSSPQGSGVTPAAPASVTAITI